MGSLVLLFAITLSVILLASYREIRQENMAMLKRHVELYYLDSETGVPAVPPDAPPDMPDTHAPEPPGRPPLDQKPDYQLSTFYSVAFGENDTVIAVDNGEKEVYSVEELIGIAKEILAGNTASGRTGALTYIVDRRPNYTLVALMDNTVSESGLNTLLRNVLIIGGAAILVMFFISLVLSKRIIRPLEENDQRQKRFISDASHELKTPVAVISTNAEMLAREIGENEWLANIRYENERMGGLVTQLLDLSRAENAEAPMEQVDFSRTVTGETLALETLAFDRGRAFRTEIEDGITLTGNRTQLTQLVSILLDNAIRHASGSEIGISLKRQGHHAVLSVVNEGDEIPQDKLEHLFDRFYRVDEARNSEGRHYGLGLSIAKAVVEKHGGSISVSCQDGKVQFTASIPIRK
ncbi:MAG: HAMP domain-containing histidine kinase [Clostridia bacterium]|nr:HAMP domain-containing histidine kinase [Clostridia bacterium]MBR7175513.1 HAMP domain-containing histidine kinase [Clostridia bacterium]